MFLPPSITPPDLSSLHFYLWWNQPVTEPVDISFWPWNFVFFRYQSPWLLTKPVTHSLLTPSRCELTILWNRLDFSTPPAVKPLKWLILYLLAETPPEAWILQQTPNISQLSSTLRVKHHCLVIQPWIIAWYCVSASWHTLIVSAATEKKKIAYTRRSPQCFHLLLCAT